MAYHGNGYSKTPKTADVGLEEYRHGSFSEGEEIDARDDYEGDSDDDRSSIGPEPDYMKQAKEDWRRFDDFVTIDWVQDTLSERARRREEQTLGYGKSTIYNWTQAIVSAGQSYFVLALVGAAIGVNAALISIITAWLSDLKLGYCSAGWWLNQKFCCWEIERGGVVGSGGGEEGCQDWITWSSWSGVKWIAYVIYAIIFSGAASYLVHAFAPFAAGSGISEIKCILAGFWIKGYLGVSTLAIKSLTLPLAIASGLSVGKEGPSVHMACSIGNVVGRLFSRFERSQAKMRDIITASSAAGVAVAFGSPIGGVLFALEEMTIAFPIKTMWRSFFCALIATVTLAAMNPFRTGKLVLFQVSYDRDWHFFEIGFFVLIGVFGGLYGAFVIKFNFQVQAFRRKHLAAYGIYEAVILAGLTAFIGYFNKFLRIDMTESLDVLFRECEGGGDYDDLCQSWAQWRMVNSLLLATVVRTLLVILSYGCKVPAGIFVPSMAVGATFGRMVGILVKAAYRAYPHAALFASCDPERPCITPGTYAFLGAAAALSGIMRITVTVVVIMFELTGALTYILPTMITVMVTKAVSDAFGKGGIADQATRFNGYPNLEKEESAFNILVSQVMKTQIVSLPARGITIGELEKILREYDYRGFPVIESPEDPLLLGSIGRQEIEDALRHIGESRNLPSYTLCVFSSTDDAEAQRRTMHEEIPGEFVDLSSWVNTTPLATSPRQPLDIVTQLFKTMGPRVIWVEEYGHLVGLLTIKDLLKEVIIHERREHAQESTLTSEELLDVMEEARAWLEDLFKGKKGRRSSPSRKHNNRSGAQVLFNADVDSR